MKISKGILLTVSNEDIVKGVFENSEVIEVADRCFYDLTDLVKVFLPNVKKIGSDCFSYNAALTEVSLPALTTAGSDCFSSNDKLVAIKIGKTKFTHKCVDGYPFIIEQTKSSKGIKIYSGYNFISLSEKKINKQKCFVASKDKFFAHGETIKKAVGDLQFKIVAEKLKNEPINKDTKFTVKYYRLLTGACDLGCRSWMEANKIAYSIVDGETIEKKPITAAELLPILEKTKAYGIEKVKQLITW